LVPFGVRGVLGVLTAVPLGSFFSLAVGRPRERWPFAGTQPLTVGAIPPESTTSPVPPWGPRTAPPPWFYRDVVFSPQARSHPVPRRSPAPMWGPPPQTPGGYKSGIPSSPQPAPGPCSTGTAHPPKSRRVTAGLPVVVKVTSCSRARARTVVGRTLARLDISRMFPCPMTPRNPPLAIPAPPKKSLER